MESLKLLFNTFPFSFDCPGGGEIQLLKTKKGLEELGVYVNFFDLWSPSLSHFNVGHVFTVQPGMSYFVEGLKARGMPVVVSPIFWPPAGASRGQMWEIERGLAFADLILPNSMTEATLLSETFDIPLDKFHVVPNAVDPDLLDRQAPEAFKAKFSIEGPYLLCVGNVEPRKNQLAVLQAMKVAGIELPLVCVGGVRDQTYFNQCATFGSLFKHVGSLPYESPLLSAAFKEAEGMILVSQFETPGLSALEAVCLGCPVLITERGCTREYFGKHVIYSDPDHLDQIASGLKALLSSPRVPVQVSQDFRNRFNWTRTAEETLAAYKKVFRK